MRFDTVSDTITSVTLAARSSAINVVATQLALANSGGDIDSDALSNALNVITSDSEDLYGTYADYAKEQSRAAYLIDALSQSAGEQLTDAEQTVSSDQSSNIPSRGLI